MTEWPKVFDSNYPFEAYQISSEAQVQILLASFEFLFLHLFTMPFGVFSHRPKRFQIFCYLFVVDTFHFYAR
ncbi:hypothetical protein GE21DRAFT_1289176 [Neurospora crassa]|nr:hypothetical protein GE21DRAFT_1289176 [Neurospora crassa]